jgi:hypothetical protein
MAQTPTLADRLEAAANELIAEAIQTEIIDPAQVHGIPNLTIARLLAQCAINLLGGTVADLRTVVNELTFAPESEDDQIEEL